MADSSLGSDRGRKLKAYAKAKIAEYWIVNLIENVIEIYREPSPEGYRSAAPAGRGDRLSVAAFAEVAFAVDEILP